MGPFPLLKISLFDAGLVLLVVLNGELIGVEDRSPLWLLLGHESINLLAA